MTPEEIFAADWVTKRFEAIEELLREDVSLRYRIVRFLLLNPETGSVKDGLPAIYLARKAASDRLLYDFLVEVIEGGQSQPAIIEEQRQYYYAGELRAPPKPRGLPYKNGGRDFLLLIMCAELQAKFPTLPFGFNDATNQPVSAVGVAFNALTAVGVPLIREKFDKGDVEDLYPIERNAEKALRRFMKAKHIPEIFLG